MKKVLCLIYPNFSLYEVVGLTSTLALSFGVEVDYVGTDRNVIRSEDGLPCQPTGTLDELVIEDYSCQTDRYFFYFFEMESCSVAQATSLTS